MDAIILLIAQALRLLSFIILADVIFSWVAPNPNAMPRSLTRRICEPLYAPLHQVLDPRKTGNIDLAPLVWILLLNAVSRALPGMF